MDQYQLFVALAPIALIISIFIAVYAWQHRQQAAAANLSVMMLLVIGYLITNSLELITPTPAETLFWAKAGYFFAPFIGVFWLGFSLDYTGKRKWLEANRFWPFFIIPTLGVILVQTNEWHHLIWTSTTFTWHSGFLALSVTYGPAFWVNTLYAYGCLAVGCYLIAREFILYSRGYRRQTFWVLAGLAFPLFAHIAYVFRIVPGWRKDYSPIGFVFTGIALAIGIFRHQLIRLAPIARSLVVDYIQDGICVLDTSDQIVDANLEFLNILGYKLHNILGQPAETQLPFWKSMQAANLADQSVLEFEVINPARTTWFEIEIKPIQRKDSKLIGRLITLHDITERKRLMAIVEQMAITDPVTGLYNRRFFDERARDELERTQRYHHSLAVLMLDLDDFKMINDLHGHGAGDDALVTISKALRESVRKIDTLARFGGDEFILLLPETSEEEAVRMAERIRTCVGESTVSTGSDEQTVTVSIGLATLDPDQSVTIEEITLRADQALYAAKHAGGNRVSVYRPGPFHETEGIGAGVSEVAWQRPAGAGEGTQLLERPDR
jgi:diguanylate cyclase (GGDEF)-like protein/PAS domain S-box-containing protein